MEILIGGAALLALIFNHGYRPLELLWTFSIYLESVAILPQLVLLLRTKEIESLTTSYILCLGGYRYAWKHFSAVSCGARPYSILCVQSHVLAELDLAHCD